MTSDRENKSAVSAVLPRVCLPSFDRLLNQLIAIPSVSSPLAEWDQSNEAVIELLADWFSTLGFEIYIQDVPNCPGKQNLIATLGKGNRGLVLSGHTDTVPFDASRWQSDPFKLQERENRFYGLGACDMKGFFPIIIEALRKMDQGKLVQPLIVLATADEESSMSGANALANSSVLTARAAVIGEPTSIKPIRMHKGIMMEVVTVKGRSGHSSNPNLGNSALEGMQDVMARLLAFRQQIQARFQHPGFEIPYPTLNLGHIHGGDSPNRICAHCELSFDLRPIPGMDPLTLREELLGLVKAIGQERHLDVSLRSLIGEVPPFEVSADSDLVKLSERLTSGPARSVAFATEAPFLSKMGMETIVLGAGSIDQAHQPNEFLAFDQIAPMTEVLKGLISHYCLE